MYLVQGNCYEQKDLEDQSGYRISKISFPGKLKPGTKNDRKEAAINLFIQEPETSDGEFITRVRVGLGIHWGMYEALILGLDHGFP